MAATNETSLVRRSLLAIGIAVGGTAIFMSACLLIASTALDRALPPTQADAIGQNDSAEVAGQSSPATEVTRVGAQPRS